MTARQKACLYIYGEQVTVECSVDAMAHLEAAAASKGLPSVSALVQSLAVCAAYPLSGREAAVMADMRYGRWLLMIALSATGYTSSVDELHRQVRRAKDALKARKQEVVA